MIDITADEFLDKGNFIECDKDESYKQVKYFWDDYNHFKDECKRLRESGIDVYIYTIIDAEGKCWISEGYRLANRLGYLVSTINVDISSCASIEYFV